MRRLEQPSLCENFMRARVASRVLEGEARRHELGALIRVAERSEIRLDGPIELKAVVTGDHKVACPRVLLALSEPSIEISGKEECIGKKRSQRLHDDQLVV